MYEIKCPRCRHEKAIISPTYGVLPGPRCQADDAHVVIKQGRVMHLRRSHRIQEQRDKHAADLLQPWDGNRANPDYFKNHPEQVDDYNVRKELEHI